VHRCTQQNQEVVARAPYSFLKTFWVEMPAGLKSKNSGKDLPAVC
jgi:hypothetical protein